MREPSLLPEHYQEGAGENEAALVLKAFKGAHLTRRPRSPEKSEWLREQGVDPDATFADRE